MVELNVERSISSLFPLLKTVIAFELGKRAKISAIKCIMVFPFSLFCRILNFLKPYKIERKNFFSNLKFQ